MGQFLGTHTGKLDTKNRVSIPALYRTQLRAGSTAGPLPPTAGTPLVARPSHFDRCIEVWSETDFLALAEPLSKLDEFSQEYDDLSIALFSDATPLEADKEGRVVLPALLTDHAGLTDKSSVVFMGRGKIFQIWEAGQAEQRKRDAQQRSRDKRPTLPGAAR
jgi:MraZ protein